LAFKVSPIILLFDFSSDAFMISTIPYARKKCKPKSTSLLMKSGSTRRPRLIAFLKLSYNSGAMSMTTHSADPLNSSEWESLLQTAKGVGNATVARRILSVTEPLGAGVQTVPTETLVGITEGYRSKLGATEQAIRISERKSGIVPLIFKDFVMHWRDLAESRAMNQGLSIAKAAAAASSCARSEDKLVLFGNEPLGYSGLMTVAGRNIFQGLQWSNTGDAFENFRKMTELLTSKGYNGPYAAVVHPRIYARLHRVLKGSSLLEMDHVKALLRAGVFRSALLAPRSGLVLSTGKQNAELVVSIDTSVAFLGAKQMNLPFRVLKAVFLRILRSDSICTF
jgi:uncharacterized linocin/CFP29 family protein